MRKFAPTGQPWWRKFTWQNRSAPYGEESRPVRINSLWPDGTLISAGSWHELEETIRGRQWHRMSTGKFRRTMRERCKTMTGQTISIQSAELMFRGLEAADMVRLEVRGEDDDAHSSRV